MKTAQKKFVQEFVSLYTVLNDAQKKAVDTTDGPVMVIAGPGTGKTTILTLRIANILLKTDTSPESILALTFTESGAHAMRSKLLEIIGPAAYRVNIHTFHGFAGRIIEDYPDYFPRVIGSVIINEADQIRLIEDIVGSRRISALRPYGDPNYYMKPLLHEIHLLKRENILPDDFEEMVKKDEKESIKKTDTEEQTRASIVEKEKRKKMLKKNRELAFVYTEYEKKLIDSKYYDFDDMLLELIRAMEISPEFKLILQENFQYILADEHQDANASQNRILELLADHFESPNLFIVGDDKQAIYRFQGASLENFLYFSKRYPGAVLIELEHNYRSHQLILDASHSLIENNPSIPGREITKLKSLQVGGRPIYITETGDLSNELDHIASTISKLISKKEKPEEIAVIFRENRHASHISRVLKNHGVPHKIESDHDILGDPDIIKLVSICRAINNLSDDTALTAALWVPELKCDPAEVAWACATSSRERKALYEVIKKSGKTGLISAYKKLVAWASESRNISFLDLLDMIVQEMNLVSSIVASPRSLERLGSLESFYEKMSRASASRRTFRLSDCIEYLDIITAHGLSGRSGHQDHISGVRLMTAHRAKGLEFNYVFIIHAVDGIWGNRRPRSYFTVPVIEHAHDKGRIEDERRLFYVAMTRAREGIHISYARRGVDKENIPSQFISELDPDTVLLERNEANTKIGRILPKMNFATALPNNSLLNAEFIKSKFLGQPLSVTHLNNYLECPWKYFFMNLVRIPQSQSKHQMYGTAIHSTLRSYFEAYRKKNDIGMKKLLSTLEKNMLKLPFSVDDRQDSLEKGIKALGGYHKKYYPEWNRNLLTEYVIGGVPFKLKGNKKIPDAVLYLTGKLDKIELLNSREVIVIDYKTGKPKSRNEIEGKTKDASGDYKRQLVFYRKLTDLSGGRFKMRFGEIDFIEPNDRDQYKKERFEINNEELEALDNIIYTFSKEITDLSFVDKGCADKSCQFCRMGMILRQTK